MLHKCLFRLNKCITFHFMIIFIYENYLVKLHSRMSSLYDYRVMKYRIIQSMRFLT